MINEDLEKAASKYETDNTIQTYDGGGFSPMETKTLAEAFEAGAEWQKEQMMIDDYNKIKKVLALGFMQFLDNNRPEGKMCLSNGECEDIDKAFKDNDWTKILRYAEKYGKKN